MKDIKCPVCGHKITPHYFIGGYLYGESLKGTYHFSCSRCRWMIETGRGTEELALREVEKFISKFPPIMRVQVGDKLNFLDRHSHFQNFATVEKVNLNDGWIKTEKGICRPDDVTKWPWELEQKGGE